MADEPMPCEKCGTPHTKCKAHTRAGKPCGQKPMRDQLVCKMHGGTSPNALAAAARRREERQALLAVESFGLPRVVDPHTALLEELHRTAGAVQWLGAVVADIDQGDLVWGKTKETHGTQLERGTDNGVTHAAGPNAFVELWQRERKHLVLVSKECLAAGIEERRVRLAESAGQQLASVVRAVLDRMLTALVEAVGAERATELALEAVWAQSALVIVPEEFRRVAEAAGELGAGGAP